MINMQPDCARSVVAEPNMLRLGIMQPNIAHPASSVCPVQVMTAVSCNSCIMKVGGKGVVKAEADRARVVLGVFTENLQLENAQNENAQHITTVIDALIRNGVLKEDIKTQTYQIQPQYDYLNGEQVFRGYRVVHEVSAEIENTSMVGAIIDEAVGAGANTVSDISFHVANPQMYYHMAINQTLSDAVSKAVSVGTKMNVYVNPIPLRITEATAPITAPMPYISMQSTEAVTPVQTGMNEITAILEVEFMYSCNGRY